MISPSTLIPHSSTNTNHSTICLS